MYIGLAGTYNNCRVRGSKELPEIKGLLLSRRI